MRTNIVIDEKLMARGMALAGCRTRREIVHLSLVELVRRKERRRLLGLAGKVIWDGKLSKLRGDGR
jgi:Arc/MetJ family transcription regulator